MLETLDILYRDDYLVAINKPAGLLVHRSDIDKYETRFAVQILRNQLGQPVFPLHRLDKPTEGVLVFGLSADVAKRMMTVFMSDDLCKIYHAVVRGYTPEADVIDYPLREELDKMTDLRADQNKAPQAAITAYRRLATVELPFAVGRYPSCRYSFLQLMPTTGRKHQLRRHLKHIFHPIVGDTTHGDGRQNNFFRDQFACRQLLLAASSLRFPHPYKDQAVTITAPFSKEFSRILLALGWSNPLNQALI